MICQLIRRRSFHVQSRYFKRLPSAQIVSLLFAYFAETTVARFAYPFLAQLVGDLDIIHGDKRRVGYYMGSLDSIGHLTTAIAVLFWGRYSDNAGRKRVLLANSAGLAAAITCFGLSKTFTGLVLSKLLEGVFKAAKPIVKTALAESSGGDEKKMALYFSVMPIMAAAASTLGPFVGGTFAKPSEQFPRLFRGWIWTGYPYLLPCLIVAFLCLLSFASTFSFFQETLPRLQTPKDIERQSCDSGDRILPSSISEPSLDNLEDAPLLRSPSPSTPAQHRTRRNLSIVLLNYGVLTFLAISFSSTFALFLASPIGSGGLSLPPSTIGAVLSLAGIFHGLVQVFFFARAHKRWGSRRIYIVAIAAFIPIYISMPIMADLSNQAGRITPFVWVLLALEEIACAFPPAGFSCMYIFITKAAPSPSALGQTHAAAQTIFSLMGAIGPASVTSLVAVSIQFNLLGGTLAYVVLAGLGLAGLGLAYLLPEDEGHLDRSQ